MWGEQLFGRSSKKPEITSPWSKNDTSLRKVILFNWKQNLIKDTNEGCWKRIHLFRGLKESNLLSKAKKISDVANFIVSSSRYSHTYIYVPQWVLVPGGKLHLECSAARVDQQRILLFFGKWGQHHQHYYLVYHHIIKIINYICRAICIFQSTSTYITQLRFWAINL